MAMKKNQKSPAGSKLTSIDYEPYFEEFFNYLDIMKTCCYKNEEDRSDRLKNE